MNAFIQPRVILLMLTFNHEDCVEISIKSLLDQSYNNFELIIVDDCSKDFTFSKLKLIVESDSRLKVFQNVNNLGMFENFRKNLEAIDNRDDFEFFAWVGPDDQWEKQWLEELVNKLVQDKESSVSQSYVEYKSERKTKLRKYVAIRGENLSYSNSKNLRNGYGELMHGLWRRSLVSKILAISDSLSFKYLLQLENLFISLLISQGGFSVVPKNLHVKNKMLGSKYRYKENKFFQNPNKIFILLCRALPRVLKIILTSKSNRKFILGSLMIDLRVSIPIRVRIND